MMIYIHEHYQEKISIPELAAAAYLSERECYRVFHDCLHMTPVEYIKAYRPQAACQMLAKGQEDGRSVLLCRGTIPLTTGKTGKGGIAYE